MTGPQERVGGSLDALIAAYAAAREQREASDRRTKELRKVEDRAEADLFDAMERVNLTSAKHDLGTFTLNDLAWAKVNDEVAARAWAEAEMPELLALNRARLSVVVRNFLKGERGELPPGVEFTTTRGINWRKPKEPA